MPRLIGIFRHKYPHIAVKLQVHSTRRISWSVANGEIDLAVVGGEIPVELNDVLEITSYAEDELALILPISHPFSSLESIQKEDYTSMKEKRDALQAELISVGEKVYKQNENADGSINTDSVETDFSTEK